MSAHVTPHEPAPSCVPLAPGIDAIPAPPGILAWALEVRRTFAASSPAVVAVEFPRALSGDLQALIDELPVLRLLAWKLPDGPARYLATDPCDARWEALRLAVERGVAVEPIDVLEGAGPTDAAAADGEAVRQLGGGVVGTLEVAARSDRPTTERHSIVAARLRVLRERHGRVLFVGLPATCAALGTLLAEESPLGDPRWTEPSPKVRTQAIRERQLGILLREVPHLAWIYEQHRTLAELSDPFLPTLALRQILEKASETYEKEYDQKVNLAEWKALYQFARNLAVIRGALRPRLYELATAAAGCVDGDFGAIVLEVAASYPPNHKEMDEDESGEGDGSEESARHQSLSLHADFDDGTERLEPAYPAPKVGEVTFTFRRRRPSEWQKMLWKNQFGVQLVFGDGICSYPPEDELIEKFFRTIRTRAFQQVSAQHSSTEEFTSSVLDGLDVRETMRRWHEGKLFVRRERIPPGKVGPVVLIWRDFPLTEQGLWRTCLYAENQNESDIAFYARPLGQEMVGPGITRTEYHGITSVYPARHIPDVWRVRPLHRWRTCARLLLASAVLLSEERYVAYVAEQPPDTELREFAREHGVAILYLPLPTFSRSLLKRTRQCHILATKSVRKWAADYIPEL